MKFIQAVKFVPPEDYADEAGGRWLIDHLKASATDLFAQQGKVYPMAILIARRDFRTRLSLKRPHPLPVPLITRSQDEKAGQMAMLRKVAKKVEAIAGGMITEAWFTTGMSQDEYLKNWWGKMEHHPSRKEMLFVTWQHRVVGLGGSMAEIVEDEEGRRLKPWQDVDNHGGVMSEILPEGEQ